MKNGIFNKIKGIAIERKPELLIATGVVGMFSASIMAVTSTPKALNLMEEKKQELGVTSLTKKESVQAAWGVYLAPAIIELLSVGCIVYGTTASVKRTSAIATAYAISEHTLKTYQDKVIEVCGEDKANEVKREVVKETAKKRPVVMEDSGSLYVTNTGEGNTLFYDSLTGRYFRSSTNAVDRAINTVNKTMISEEYVTVNDLYNEIGLPTVQIGELLGWSVNNESIEVSYDSDIEVDGQPYVIMELKTSPKPLKTSCRW